MSGRVRGWKRAFWPLAPASFQGPPLPGQRLNDHLLCFRPNTGHRSDRRPHPCRPWGERAAGTCLAGGAHIFSLQARLLYFPLNIRTAGFMLTLVK